MIVTTKDTGTKTTVIMRTGAMIAGTGVIRAGITETGVDIPFILPCNNT